METRQTPDEYWMGLALEEARKAAALDEVPIGAVIVKDEKIVATGYNLTRNCGNPLAHAEKIAIEKVIDSGEKFLYDYTLFVTIEPCLMCAGAIIWSRVGRVVFGAYDAKAGAVGSIYNVLRDKSVNHHPEVISGVREAECSQLIQEFFQNKRN